MTCRRTMWDGGEARHGHIFAPEPLASASRRPRKELRAALTNAAYRRLRRLFPLPLRAVARWSGGTACYAMHHMNVSANIQTDSFHHRYSAINATGGILPVVRTFAKTRDDDDDARPLGDRHRQSPSFNGAYK